MGIEVIERGAARSGRGRGPGRAAAALLLAVPLLAGGCGSAEKRAEGACREAAALVAKGDRRRAHEALHRAVRLATQAGSQSLIARAEAALGGLFYEAGTLDSAFVHLRAAEDASRRTTDRTDLGTVLNNIGLIEKARGNLDAAEALYLEAVGEHHRSKDRRGEAAALNNLGAVARERGDIPAARDLFLRALGIARMASDSLSIGRSLLSVGDLEMLAGMPDDASQAFEEAIATFRALSSDRPEIGYALLRQGRIHEGLADLPEAKRLYLASLAQYRRIGDLEGAAAANGALGTLALQEGRFEEADRLLAEALPAYRRAGDGEGLSALLASLGAARRARGDLPGAAEAYGEALEARVRAADPRGAAAVAMNLGAVLEEGGEIAPAGRAYREAREALASVGDSAGVREAEAALLRLKARGAAGAAP